MIKQLINEERRLESEFKREHRISGKTMRRLQKKLRREAK